MSKLYNIYKELKLQNSSVLYLFKSGIFYIFLDEDARKMSSALNLKLTNLNESVVKCGFPIQNLDKYLNLLKNMNYEAKIVDTSIDSKPFTVKNYVENNDIQTFLSELADIDVENLSIREAYSLLEKIHEKAEKLK